MKLPLADFSHLPTHCPYIALMPQWDFLNFLAEKASRFPGFRLWLEAEVTDLQEDSGRVVGIRARTRGGPVTVRAELVVAADGRQSIVRERAGLPVKEIGSPMDVLWFRLSRRPDDPSQTMGRFDIGQIFITLNRGAYWQCGYVIPKGRFEEIRQRGLPAFREKIAQLAPYAKDRTGELRDWDDVKLLTVRVDRVCQWFRPGLLCIGDAAHAMSPVGGVGINLAIQDAVAAANILAIPIAEGRLTIDHLRQVQKRRELPTRITQWIQVMIQRRIIARVLGNSEPLRPPRPIQFIANFPFLRRIPAWLIGIGVRPEHVRVSAGATGVQPRL